jgi:hypothetical protein
MVGCLCADAVLNNFLFGVMPIDLAAFAAV